LSTSRLEQGRGPFGLFGFQARHDRISAILDLAAIRAKIVGLVENVLKVEWHIGVARREGDGDLGEPPSQSDRIDKDSGRLR
jgi:hypothetical protein